MTWAEQSYEDRAAESEAARDRHDRETEAAYVALVGALSKRRADPSMRSVAREAVSTLRSLANVNRWTF